MKGLLVRLSYRHLIAACSGLHVYEVLRFLRVNMSYKGEPIVGVWMKGAGKYLPIPVQVFTKAVKDSKMGHNQDKRPFLSEDSEDTIITENNSIRRSCSCVYLKSLPSDLVADIEKVTVASPLEFDSEDEPNMKGDEKLTNAVAGKKIESASTHSGDNSHEKGKRDKRQRIDSDSEDDLNRKGDEKLTNAVAGESASTYSGDNSHEKGKRDKRQRIDSDSEDDLNRKGDEKLTNAVAGESASTHSGDNTHEKGKRDKHNRIDSDSEDDLNRKGDDESTSGIAKSLKRELPRGNTARERFARNKAQAERRIGTRSSSNVRDFSKQICFGKCLYDK